MWHFINICSFILDERNRPSRVAVYGFGWVGVLSIIMAFAAPREALPLVLAAAVLSLTAAVACLLPGDWWEGRERR